MLAPRGCCSMLLLLLHPSPAKIGASAPCSSSPGSSGAAMPGWCPPGTGREVPGDALSSASVSAAFCCPDLASTPKNGGKKKNHPSQGVPPGPEDELPNPEGNTQNLAGAQKAKKKPKPKTPKSQGFVQEHSLLWPQPSSHHLQRGPSCGVVQRLTMQIKLGLPQKC